MFRQPHDSDLSRQTAVHSAAVAGGIGAASRARRSDEVARGNRWTTAVVAGSTRSFGPAARGHGLPSGFGVIGRRVERVVLGAGMDVMAIAIERRVARGSRAA